MEVFFESVVLRLFLGLFLGGLVFFFIAYSVGLVGLFGFLYLSGLLARSIFRRLPREGLCDFGIGGCVVNETARRPLLLYGEDR